MRQIEISDTALLDCEQIAHGTYSPLTGFMDSATINLVLDNNTLPNGTVWTMPILLHVREDDAERSKIGEKGH